MIIKSSTALRNGYNDLSSLTRETGEPIYITKNGEGDTVIMSVEAFEHKEQLLKLREKMLRAEQQRLNGEMLPLDEAMQEIREGFSDYD